MRVFDFCFSSPSLLLFLACVFDSACILLDGGFFSIRDEWGDCFDGDAFELKALRVVT